MLQTGFKTNSENNASVLPKTDKQADIVKRLEELNKWNEEQKKILEIKQIKQRQMLGVEHKKIYEILDLRSESAETLVPDERNEKVESVICQENGGQLDENIVEIMGRSQIEEKYDLSTGKDAENYMDLPRTRPKRPFLKRGEGLKQRFKIDPNEFRLDNLPKYKYANAHPNLLLKPLNKSNKRAEKRMKSTGINQQSNSQARSTENFKNLDAQEQRFQNLLISSKLSCSSTPETKFSIVTSKIPAQPSNNILATVQKHDEFMPTKKNQNIVTEVIAWSKILDPLEIEPIHVPRIIKPNIPETEESIFELLEQKAEEGSFDMESTCLKDFMTRRIAEKLNETDDNIPVKEQLKNKRLEPLVLDNNPTDDHSSSCSSDEAVAKESQATEDTESTSYQTTHKTIETTNSTLNPHTPQVRVRFSDSNETHEYEEESDTTANDTSRFPAGSNQQETERDISKNDLFLQFKEALFSALQVKADQYLANDSTLHSDNDTLTDKNPNSVPNNVDNSNSIYSPACRELQEKTDVIKKRLADLEKEVIFFKENNLLLLKAKQEHELEKAANAQEHLEAMESLKDDKIRMEIYLHDERIKLEDEKRQFEQNVKMKTQGLIAKERKEGERLKEQLNHLETQLKTKEGNHTAAQARLRTQVRNLEREQNRLHDQIESLLKENKRLENENLKISREQNNKILLEINRNIAKLAPKQIQQSNVLIPDEGPPTLGPARTVSKCIVATAAANRNCTKPHKNTSTRNTNAQPPANHKISRSIKDKGTETPEEKNFEEENTQYQEQKIDEMNFDFDDEDDVLEEFNLTPEKRNRPPTKTNNIPLSKPSSKGKNKEPVPPPSSPRLSAAMNMKREIVNTDGSKDIWYPNGNLKKISADGMKIRMLYYNKDIKETDINEGTVKYYYAETNTWHTSYLDGLEILEFPNGQVEHRHKNGVVEVHYPNNSVKIINPKDEHKQEDWRFSDGTHLVQMRNGDKILSLPNGQKEIHNKLHKRREYPDGTVKIVYPDGSTETRYSNGRVRLKDKEGKLVMDTDMAN